MAPCKKCKYSTQSCIYTAIPCQGRCIWHNPVMKNEDEFDDEEAEEEQEEIEEPHPETGPPLLASVNEDDG